MVFARSLLSALLAGAFAVEGFTPASFVSSFATRLYEKPEELKPWGGAIFRDSNPDFAYADVRPDLTSVNLTQNLDNINKITRMQKIKWPEFSWLEKIGDPSSRLYVTFAQDVSRIGYDDDGRIWSLICPQRGIALSTLGVAFIEVTVTGVRGWVDEDTYSCYADVAVEGNLWIEPALENPVVVALKRIFDKFLPDARLPFCKKKAVKVDAHQVGKPWQADWPMVNGTDPTIFQPMFKRHYGEEGVYSAYNLEVEMGKRRATAGSEISRFIQRNAS